MVDRPASGISHHIGGVVCIASAEPAHLAGLKTAISSVPRPLQRFAFLIGIVVSRGHRFHPQAHEQGCRSSLGPQPGRSPAPPRRQHPDIRPLQQQFPVIGANKTTTIHHKSEYVVLNALARRSWPTAIPLLARFGTIEVRGFRHRLGEGRRAPGSPHGHGDQAAF